MHAAVFTALPKVRTRWFKEGPDAEAQEFRLADLEVRLRTMQAGAESDYLSGVSASRTAMSHSRFIGYPVFQPLGTVFSLATASVRRETQPGGVGPERGCIGSC